jgi:hypothetical protein
MELPEFIVRFIPPSHPSLTSVSDKALDSSDLRLAASAVARMASPTPYLTELRSRLASSSSLPTFYDLLIAISTASPDLGLTCLTSFTMPNELVFKSVVKALETAQEMEDFRDELSVAFRKVRGDVRVERRAEKVDIDDVWDKVVAGTMRGGLTEGGV